MRRPSTSRYPVIAARLGLAALGDFRVTGASAMRRHLFAAGTYSAPEPPARPPPQTIREWPVQTLAAWVGRGNGGLAIRRQVFVAGASATFAGRCVSWPYPPTSTTSLPVHTA